MKQDKVQKPKQLIRVVFKTGWGLQILTDDPSKEAQLYSVKNPDTFAGVQVLDSDWQPPQDRKNVYKGAFLANPS